ncbi:unnamed protein product [Fraxinus pennsylvanica]|uniref:Uncharacterized protein n=1 Tax=Fraxinus pennsylvanica TaxID=56036 RepID=A0AAD1ZNE8_9LAMI|nr:unnamed protein product [Fraxinus pennsylvanica]
MLLSRRVVFFVRGSELSHYIPSRQRWISSTSHLNSSWMDKVKGVFTGKMTASDTATAESFTLLRWDLKGLSFKYGNECVNGGLVLEKFWDLVVIREYVIGKKREKLNIQTSQKQEAANQCYCTIADVENTLAKFTWAKEAQRKIEKLKEEGKPMPKSLAEVLASLTGQVLSAIFTFLTNFAYVAL